MSIYNPNALSFISPDIARKVRTLEAFIYTETEIIYCFIQNPQSISVTNKANYNTIDVPGTIASKHVFQNTENKTISLPVTFDSYSLGLSLDNLVSKIESLMLPIEGKENPPLIGFRWGATDYYPAYLMNFDYKVSMLLSGSKAYLEATLELELTDEVTVLNPLVEAAVAESLTEREMIEAGEIVDADIRANPEIVGGFQDYGRYINGAMTLITDDTGIISTVFDGVQKVLGRFNTLNNSVDYE